MAPEQRPYLADGVRTTSPLTQVMGDYLAVRTHFFDAHLLSTARAGARQVVLLGAGLDARAFRLPWPAGTTIYEVDSPQMHAFKRELLCRTQLQPMAQHVPVSADLHGLSGAWEHALAAAGFDATRPTSWLAEGLLFYLDRATCDRLVAPASRRSASTNWLAGDYATSTPQQRAAFIVQHRRGTAQAGSDLSGAAPEPGLIERAILPHAQPGPGEPPERWLPSPPWAVSQTTSASHGGRIGRPVPAWWDPRCGGEAMWMFTAEHRGGPSR